MKHDSSFESCEPQVEANLSAANAGGHVKNLAKDHGNGTIV
jgi:hypothetical protein